MVEIGRFNQLPVCQHQNEFYFDDETVGKIIFPTHEVPKDIQQDQICNVFIYRGKKEQLTATLQTPYAQVDEIAWLRVVENSKIGAFLNWGLSKDLFVPFNEQRYPLVINQFYLVKVFLDDQDRITATTRFERFIIDESFYFKDGQAVDIIITDKTDLGVKAIVNHSHWGILYNNEIFQPLKKGDQLKAYIKKIRDDKKIDLSLQALVPIHTQTQDLSDKILSYLTAQKGFVPLGDKSPAEDIYNTFAVSKKAFKQALGALYKKQLISIDKHSIRLR